MTTFRAPFHVRKGNSLTSETTVMTVDASGTAAIGGHVLAASAVTLNVPTTVQTSTRSSADALIQMTVNGTIYYVPAYTSG